MNLKYTVETTDGKSYEIGTIQNEPTLYVRKITNPLSTESKMWYVLEDPELESGMNIVGVADNKVLVTLPIKYINETIKEKPDSPSTSDYKSRRALFSLALKNPLDVDKDHDN